LFSNLYEVLSTNKNRPVEREVNYPIPFFSLEKTVGIPEFWLQVFKNSDVLAELIKVLKTNDITQINSNLGTR